MQNKKTTKSTKAQPSKPAQKSTPQKADPKKQSKTQQAPQQQQQQQQQQPQQPQEPKLEISKTVKLTQMLQIFEEDKKEAKKTSFIIDEQGNANVFFKYKGEVIDLTEYVIKEKTSGASHEDNVEHARRMIVYALKSGGLLCFHMDLFSTSFDEYFKQFIHILIFQMGCKMVVTRKYIQLCYYRR